MGDYPFWYGGFSGMFAASCTHPLDLAKARMQASAKPGAGMFSTFKHVIQARGILGIYDGLSASLLRQITYTSVRIGAYERFKALASKDGETPSTAVLLPISMASGAVGSIVGNPADVVNVRMQNDMALEAAKRRNYKHAFDGFYRIYRDEGAKALFRGAGPNVVRGVLMTASQVVSYDRAKAFFVHNLSMDPGATSTFFWASMVSGLVATTVCSPADVIKTRIMNSSGKIAPINAIVNAVKTEGPLVLLRGWLPAFVRLGPNTIIMFLVMEQLKLHRVGM